MFFKQLCEVVGQQCFAKNLLTGLTKSQGYIGHKVNLVPLACDDARFGAFDPLVHLIQDTETRSIVKVTFFVQSGYSPRRPRQKKNKKKL